MYELSPVELYEKLRTRELTLCPHNWTGFPHDDIILSRMMGDVPGDDKSLPERCLSIRDIRTIEDAHDALCVDAVVSVTLFDPKDPDRTVTKLLHKDPCVYCPKACYAHP